MEFTEQQRHAIDDICKRGFENLTSDEVQLLVSWETEKAISGAKYEAEEKRRDEYLEKRNEESKLKFNEQMEILRTKKEIAKERLERVRNGQEK